MKNENRVRQWESLYSIPKKKGKDYHKERSIPVEQIDLETGEVIATFSSIYAATHETGISSIRACVKGRVHTAGGYRWREAIELPNGVRSDDEAETIEGEHHD